MDYDRRELLPRTLPPSPRTSLVAVGAAPWIVSSGAPGARDEVRAYATRIAGAWEAFWVADVAPQLGELGKLAPAKLELVFRVRDDRLAFDVYRESIGGFSLFGPSPSEAWQTLITFEETLVADRKAFAAVFGPLKSATPNALEAEGGIKQPTLGDIGKVGSAIAGPVTFLAAAFALFAVAKLVRG